MSQQHKSPAAYQAEYQAARRDRLSGMALTKSETLIVAALCRGQRRKEVAADLHIAMKTIDTHLYNIYAKLEVHSLPELFLRVNGPVKVLVAPTHRDAQLMHVMAKLVRVEGKIDAIMAVLLGMGTR